MVARRTFAVDASANEYGIAKVDSRYIAIIGSQMNIILDRSLNALFSVVVLLAASTVSLACACCADRGQYWVYSSRPDTYTLGILKDMRMGPDVRLFTTDGDEDIKGIGKHAWEDLSLVDAFTNNSWKITISSASGRSGTLYLPRPAKMTTKKIDIHERDEGEPVIYKEFVFEGIVGSGSGEFKSGIVRPTKYTLIFQGRGNNCDNAEDFTHWRLRITGSKAGFAFFGKMRSS